MNYGVYVLVFLSVMISGCSVVVFKIPNKALKLILSFSGAYLFAISVLHLIPELYQSNEANIGAYILIGFFIQILLEFFSEGIEHGHIHIHHEQHNTFPSTVIVALSIHSFIEGMPLSEGISATQSIGNQQLLVGIILHNIPISIALMSMLIQSKIATSKALVWLVVFALMTPLGTFVAHVIEIGETHKISHYFNKMMAVVIGIFLHISTTILFESSENHRFNLIKFITIISGALLAFLWL